MFSQTDWPPRLRGMTWSTVRPAAPAAAVLAGPGVAGEHRLAGDLAAVDVAGDADVAHQPDDAGALEREALGVEGALAALEDLRALLEHEHGGAPDVADVDRLVARVEDEDAAADSRVPVMAVQREAVPVDVGNDLRAPESWRSEALREGRPPLSIAPRL